MQKERNIIDGRIWRWLVNVWTFVLFFFILADFFNNGGLDNILGPVAAIYVASLAIYSAEKEFERWQLYSVGRHPGEVYVFIWTMLVIGMFVYTLVTKSSYKMSQEIFSTYIVVLGILAITRKSKNLFKERNRDK
jgi:hypothetical protein